MKNEILIPSAVVPNAYFLGPMGDPDPSDFIYQETHQIPFKRFVVDLSSWNKTPFRNWPKAPKGWRDWFCRVSAKKGGDWELYDLNQCLTLSLSEMERNDSLLISASYFWSNALNAFIFGHGPMTITLADVYMLTGLRTTGSMQPYEYLSASSKRLAKIADYTGWVRFWTMWRMDHLSTNENMWPFWICGWRNLSFVGRLVAQLIITNL